jgi:hypothetical protein
LSIKFPTTTDELSTAAYGFTSISSNSAIDNFVGVVEGYHLEIITPTKKEVQNVKSFFPANTKLMGSMCRHPAITTVGLHSWVLLVLVS